MAKIWISASHLVVILSVGAMAISEAATVPAIFIFGDSTADVGTNNHLPRSLSRANFSYNGIDYPNSVPTGRFSNGYNIVDEIAILVGYEESPPPFLSLVEKQSNLKRSVLRGVNFASGAAGILDAIGQYKVRQRISLTEQIEQFETVKENITEILGKEAAATMLSKSLFIISVGNNDLLGFQRVFGNLTTPDFMDTLQSNFSRHLKNLYDMGARKFGIISVGAIGCLPSQRMFDYPKTRCIKKLNHLAQIFYITIEALLERLSSELKGMKYSLGDAYKMSITIIKNPKAFGFKKIKQACCGMGQNNALFTCIKAKATKLCSNRSDHLFWDWFHPTQAACNLGAQTLYDGPLEFVKPINFHQLAQLNV